MKAFWERPLVYLVGAGPGDPGLLTLKGKSLLEKADVVVYDQLANLALLRWVPPQAERIDVGKKAGQHTLPQDKINQLLVQKAQEGKTVVRLKGGDPFVFGRGGEEAEYLLAHGCRYEVVPGVTSAVAVPAYAGIPVTHRDLTSTVTFITGHEASHESRLNWQQLAPGSGTLVFLMGRKNLPDIAQNLIRFGRAPETPAAVISHGTHNDQRTVTGTLEEIAKKVQQADLPTPAIIVVGEVAALRGHLEWLEKRPLFGKKVLITRAEEQAEEWAQMLSRHGAVPLVCPLIAIQPRPVGKELEALLKGKGAYQWLIFTSVNGVNLFFKALFQSGRDVRSLGGCRVAAIGAKTAEALQAYGIRADVVPQVYRAEALAETLLPYLEPQDRILLPRAAKTRDVLVRMLREAGHSADELPLYDTVVQRNNQALLRQLLPEADYLTFASSSAVQAFFQCISRQDYQKIRQERRKSEKDSRIAVIGPITAHTLQMFGMTADVMPLTYTLPDLLQAIENDVLERNRSDQ